MDHPAFELLRAASQFRWMISVTTPRSTPTLPPQSPPCLERPDLLTSTGVNSSTYQRHIVPKSIITPAIAIVNPTAERIPTTAQKTIGLSSRFAL